MRCVMTTAHLRVNVIQGKIVGGATISTLVLPMVFNGLSPHPLCFAACHGPEEEEVVRRIFERHEPLQWFTSSFS